MVEWTIQVDIDEIDLKQARRDGYFEIDCSDYFDVDEIIREYADTEEIIADADSDTLISELERRGIEYNEENGLEYCSKQIFSLPRWRAHDFMCDILKLPHSASNEDMCNLIKEIA